MSELQALFVCAMGAAFICGRPHWIIAAGMAIDLAVTMALAPDYITVAVADLLAATAMLFAGRRGQIVALLFVMMQPIYVIGFGFEWPTDATYAIVELFAYAQLAVIGRLDVGISSIRRHLASRSWRISRRTGHLSHTETNGGHAVSGVARISAEGQR